MKNIRIFIASSSELKEDRVQFELFIGQKNNHLYKKGLRLEVVQWEYFKDSMSATRLQDEYNKSIRESDFVLCLFYTKVGKYTEEEFSTAYEIFKAEGKPRIWTYFKNAEIKTAAIVRDDINSLFDFKERLGSMGHFFTEYTSIQDLLLKYGAQLDMLLPEYELDSNSVSNGDKMGNPTQKDKEDIKNTFNDELTGKVLLAVSNHNKKAKSFLLANPSWAENTQLVQKAKQLIISEFVGVLGGQVRKLISIGEEDYRQSKMKRYLENCLLTAKRGFQLISYSLISTLWDYQLEHKVTFTQSQKDVLNKFFINVVEDSVVGYATLVRALAEIYTENKQDFLISEVFELLPQLQEGGSLYDACVNLNKITELLENDAFTLLDCTEAETNITIVLESLSFLAGYRMISISEIDYDQQRNDSQGQYLHNYILLDGNNPANNASMGKVKNENKPVISHAIIIFKGDNYKENINLGPFIIDFNGLGLLDGSKICFYASCDTYDDMSLSYSFIEDNSVVKLNISDNPKPVHTDLNGLNRWLASKENRKMMNFDKVYSLFFEAKKTLTGIEEESTEDLF